MKKLFDKIYNWFFVEVKVEEPTEPVYISCCDLFLKQEDHELCA